MKSVFYPLGKSAPPGKEECNLCGRVFPYYSLRRCFRCGKLYCKSCITENLTDRSYIICLNCARRFVSPRRSGTKYTPLSVYLSRRARWTNGVKLTFSGVEEIIGDDLPLSAKRSKGWWSNTRSRSHAQAWLDVGWKVQEVDLNHGTVTFKRPNILKIEKKSTKKGVSASLPTFKPRRFRKPSLTRIAKAQARLKNEFKKSTLRKYRGKFKPKPAHEKRLYKPEEKP